VRRFLVTVPDEFKQKKTRPVLSKSSAIFVVRRHITKVVERHVILAVVLKNGII
jgi:hypothetical protein